MRDRVSKGRRTAAPWRLGAILIAVSVGTISAAGCRGAADTAKDISVQVKISPQRVRIGEATIVIQLVDPFARPVTHAKISMEADMSHPGMSPVFATASETAPGVYTAPLDFNMGGDWVVLSHIVLADGRKLERRIDVKGVEPNR